MRALSVLSFVTLAVAGPIGTLLEKPRDLERRDSVTATQLSNFEFYVQHAAAAYCNTATPAGSAVQCSDNACPAVEGDSATVVASFTGLVTGIGGYVATDAARGEIVISIRGSINVRNWITNFDFPLTSCSLTSGCEVHTGFQNAWNEISSAVNTAVASALKANPSYKIISTGHSLGAAVATLAAANMRKSGYAIDLYTYGSPRVGNDVFANFVTAQTGAEYRVTHGDDPVPRLPPLIFGFRHTSPEYWLDGGSTDITYTTSEIEVCAGIANLSCNGGTLGLDVIAHLEYFENVSACSLSSILKRGNEGDMSDEELEAKLNTYSQMDQEFVANMNNSS